ncbi:amidohydrolase family protein [Terrabacter terrigena]|uniref:Amidohydrolase family protein n=1 Tax=Terrabacter terrigena TaxID=574718 RepID=A0ABW3MYZ1_9MICO
MTGSGPSSDADVPGWVASLGLPGLVDLHVHFMPESVQQKVWGFFDQVAERGDPPWPITYRQDVEDRVAVLRGLGVRAFTSLNYAHRPGMSRWLNDFSATFAADHDDAIHSATFFPEPGVTTMVAEALGSGARVFKVHVQVGEFSPLDPALDAAWGLIAASRAPVVIHCGHGPHRGRHTGPEPIRELVRRFPALVLVIAHAGLPDYREFAGLAARHPNVYLDTTMVGTIYMERIAPVPADYPALMADLEGKVVLGTDFPSIPYPYSHQLEVLSDWGLGDRWLREVLWHTPNRLLTGRQDASGLDGRPSPPVSP